MKTTMAILVVVAAALWVAADAQSDSVKEGANLAAENLKEKADDAKDKANSWTGWAYDKITQGNAEDAKDKTIDATMEKGNDAGETIKMATDKAGEAKGSMMEGAKEKMNQAADMASEKAGQVKEKAGQMYGQTTEL